MRHTLQRFFSSLVLLVLCGVPLVASAADVYCDTPPLTKVLFVEVQAYTQTLKKTLQDNKCVSEYGMFGTLFTSISDQESQLAQKFWNTHASSLATKDAENAMFSGANDIPALLHQDAESMKKYLEELRPLVSKSMGDCATDNNIHVDEKSGNRIISVPLSDSATGRYLAYRGLYEMLINAQKQKVEILPSTALEGSGGEIYLQTLAGFTKKSGGNNPFFTMKDYRKDGFSQCQAEEFGLDRINDSITALQETLASTKKEVEELGAATGSIKDGWGESLLQMQKFAQNLATTQNDSASPKARTEAAAYIGKSLRQIISLPLSGPREMLLGLMEVPNRLRASGMPLRVFSFSEVQQDIVSVDYEVGKITQKSLSQVIGDYTKKVQKAETIKEQALDDYESKSYDTLGVFTSTQFFLQKMDRASATIDTINLDLQGARKDFTSVCHKHLPNPNDDCGEEKK